MRISVSSLETYGAKVDQLKAEVGAAPSQEAIESALKSKKYRLLTFTHVDTSTGWRNFTYICAWCLNQLQGCSPTPRLSRKR